MLPTCLCDYWETAWELSAPAWRMRFIMSRSGFSATTQNVSMPTGLLPQAYTWSSLSMPWAAKLVRKTASSGRVSGLWHLTPPTKRILLLSSLSRASVASESTVIMQHLAEPDWINWNKMDSTYSTCRTDERISDKLWVQAMPKCCRM